MRTNRELRHIREMIRAQIKHFRTAAPALAVRSPLARAEISSECPLSARLSRSLLRTAGMGLQERFVPRRLRARFGVES
jgi:hypothetical protein